MKGTRSKLRSLLAMTLSLTTLLLPVNTYALEGSLGTEENAGNPPVAAITIGETVTEHKTRMRAMVP